jgi:hypothetical protein
LASISSPELASAILDQCLREGAWNDSDLEQLVRLAISDDARTASEASGALFAVVVERLGDLFEPRLCTVYARLFSRVLELVGNSIRADELVARYERVRVPRPCTMEPRVVYVLSRVTLGADVAVTSVLLAAARRRFPNARVVFMGPKKNFALFERSGVELLEFSYRRTGNLTERIAACPVLDSTNAIVLDPDSRLTQLGLLPVSPEERYFFFESRAAGSDTKLPLASLASSWCEQVLGFGAAPFLAPAIYEGEVDVAVSLGVGENPEKRLDAKFERGLLEGLAARGRRVLVDRGAGEEETSRVDRAAAGLEQVTMYDGDYAPFAARIMKAKLYIGYDSAGQHVASAAGVPLISVFRGFASERMLQRWTPAGHQDIAVIPVRGNEDPLAAVMEVSDKWR